MYNSKEKLIKYAHSLELPVFLQPWWLDIVYCNNWDVVLYQNNDEIEGFWVYSVHEKNGLNYITMPPLTQYQGAWLKNGNSKYSKELSRQKEVYQHLIRKLPAVDYFRHNLSKDVTYLLPFIWLGFKQTSKFTYQINTSDLNFCWNEMLDKTRNEIRKAEKNKILIEESENHTELLALHKMTFLRQKKAYPYSDEMFYKIIQESIKQQKGKVLIAKDVEGNAHAGAFLLEDSNTVYYLIGGGNPDLRNSGATSLLIWNAIKYAIGKKKIFDFEGSMIEPIEKFFRSFGARQIQYNTLTFTSKKFNEHEDKIKAKIYLKNKIKSMLRIK